MFLDDVKNALGGVERLQQQYPNDPAIDSVAEQLRYLAALEEGMDTDTSKLNRINIGLIAVRQIEELDPPLANQLHAIEHMVRERLA